MLNIFLRMYRIILASIIFVTFCYPYQAIYAVNAHFTVDVLGQNTLVLDASASTGGISQREWTECQGNNCQFTEIPNSTNLEIVNVVKEPLPSSSSGKFNYAVKLKVCDDVYNCNSITRYIYRERNRIINASVSKDELPVMSQVRLPVRINQEPANHYALLRDKFDPESYPKITSINAKFSKLLATNPENGHHEWIVITPHASKWSIWPVPYFNIQNNSVNDVIDTYDENSNCTVCAIHIGEDWNTTREDDEGKHLFPIADGVVLYKEYGNGCTEYATLGILHRKINPNMPDGYEYFTSEYWHAKNIQVVVGQRVNTNTYIAEVSNCKTPGSHLHLHMLKDVAINTTRNEVVLINNAAWWPQNETVIKNYYHIPSKFIIEHSLANITPVFYKNTGLVHIRGGNFGNTPGTVNVTAKVIGHDILQTFPAIVLNNKWHDNQIIANLFGVQTAMPLTFDSLDGPLLVQVIGNTNKTVVAESFYPFKDVESKDWYDHYVVNMWKRSIVSGIGTTGFYAPNMPTSFAAFLKILVNASPNLDPSECLAGQRPSAVNSFSNDDFPLYNNTTKKPWFCKYYNNNTINKLIQELLSINSNTARPSQNVTRKEVAFFLSKVLKLHGPVKSEPSFSDVDATNEFAFDIKLCKSYHIFKGYGDRKFRPDNEITRAQVAKVIECAFYPSAGCKQ
jgi:murein DD-endopeptidase MepM/ murein hydrolase activator NlpD